ncbi:MAG: hypothetical protein ABMA26_13225 [Limisphaerales bacterium]
MSTTTAHILIGRSHPYHDCIIPTHVLTLHENSRPLLVLRPYPVTMPERLADGVAPPGEVHWVPTLKHMFEDALLMVAVHALKVPEVVKPAATFLRMHEVRFLDLSKQENSRWLKLLHARCRAHFPSRSKLAISLFYHSAVFGHVKVLKDYPMEVELCTPVFDRFWHRSDEAMVETGTLEIPTFSEWDPEADDAESGLLAEVRRKNEKRARTDTQR